MPPEKKQKILNENSRTAELLVELVDNLDLIFTFDYQPFAVMKYGMSGIRDMRKARAKRMEREAIRRLKARNLIEIDKRADDVYVALTEAGAKEYLRLKVLDADLYDDERACLVVFDIPETKRRIRKSLRAFLSNAGFIPIQKSVWISKFAAGKAISKLLTVKGSKHWVRIFEVREQ